MRNPKPPTGPKPAPPAAPPSRPARAAALSDPRLSALERIAAAVDRNTEAMTELVKVGMACAQELARLADETVQLCTMQAEGGGETFIGSLDLAGKPIEPPR